MHNQRPLESNLDTNTIHSPTPECIILPTGRVHCPTAIYQDKKTWRRSRHQVENEIQQLKEKLEKLKEIRKHLKQSKPLEEIEEDTVDDIFNTTEPTDFNQLHVNLAPNMYPLYPVAVDIPQNMTTEKPQFLAVTERTHSKKRRPNEDTQRNHKRKRPKMVHEENASDVENNSNVTHGPAVIQEETPTLSPDNSVNHHRHHHHHHHHHKHHTTTNYNEVSSEAASVSTARPSTENTESTRQKVS